MKRALLQVFHVASMLVLLASAESCAKKKVVDRRDFQEVNDYVDKNLRASGVTADKRKKYVLDKLGAPHHTSGGASYWYSTADNCYYLQMGEDGWTSWGTGVTSDCKFYGYMP
jgi:hypothetical protein